MPSKYDREVPGADVTIDVYDVLLAFGVPCHATGHAIKKLLAAGRRGHKDRLQDLEEAQASISRAIELAKHEKGTP
ncbi:MAG: hypothetical protein AAF192_08675 [Pseudomonadota bacterium]